MSGDPTAALRAAAAEGLNAAATLVRDVARSRAPVGETGDLRESLDVDPASAGALEATVGTSLEYAVYQHETLDLQHDDGQAKFLESAAIESIGQLEQIIAARVRAALGG
ncbi:HK97 gp10 family phage protein [Oerskovia enterophila]|uniref:Uncharacterized protein n=1 Tax=Oerskovia enterophila TaxID=43678 RepID=A0ABX2YAR3_9CELL|nr:HK97 gp10 family phage protein [Oerskovia enterophila]OCI31050.1 hypothetical protein OERS_22600 [Oerskovia enterophila]